MIQEKNSVLRMNSKVDETGEILAATYATFEKNLVLQQPFYYDTRMELGCDGNHDAELYAAYWYHPDHLGSSSYITNLDGEINQHIEYLPFGELLVEEHLNSYNSPFKFNAKEFDAETGNYYYGARYYDPKWIIWLSVDKEFARFPSYSPYNYTLLNPINLIDPDGNAPCPPGVDCRDPLPNIDIVSPGASGKKGGTFGYTRSGGRQFHSGIDLRASTGTNLRAPLGGNIVYAKNNHASDEYSGSSRRPGVSKYPTTGYGNAVVLEYTIEKSFDIEGKNGKVSLSEGQKVYMRFTHMDNVDESLLGKDVGIGDILGQTGATGNPGLHNGRWGIEEENRHTHMEVSTEMNKDGSLSKGGMIDARMFIKSEIDSHGNVTPASPPPVDSSLQGKPK